MATLVQPKDKTVKANGSIYIIWIGGPKENLRYYCSTDCGGIAIHGTTFQGIPPDYHIFALDQRGRGK
ncbi:MAG: hypothetical protein Ct9H300mP11_14440 [Chloroflexota bacterium]|nr:MAG: hypothetical protein Ct9H300mP11_14440 [Chloroflexota bacterium]